MLVARRPLDLHFDGHRRNSQILGCSWKVCQIFEHHLPGGGREILFGGRLNFSSYKISCADFEFRSRQKRRIWCVLKAYLPFSFCFLANSSGGLPTPNLRNNGFRSVTLRNSHPIRPKSGRQRNSLLFHPPDWRTERLVDRWAFSKAEKTANPRLRIQKPKVP